MKAWIETYHGSASYAQAKHLYGLVWFKSVTVQTRDRMITLDDVVAGKSAAAALLEGKTRALGFVRSKTRNYLVATLADADPIKDTSVASWSKATNAGGFDPGSADEAWFWVILASPYLLYSYLSFNRIKTLCADTDWYRLLKPPA